MKKLLPLFLMVTAAQAEQTPGPFGLAWGMTKEQVIATKTSLQQPTEYPPAIQCYEAMDMPLMPGRWLVPGSYQACFAKHDGLVVFTMTVGFYERDNEGRKILGDYFILKDRLTRQYGQPTGACEPMEENKNFHQYLVTQTQCESWGSYFDAGEGGDVVIELLGRAQGSGHIRVTYRSPSLLDMLEADQGLE